LVVLAVAITVCLCLLEYGCVYQNPHWETITVKDKSIKANMYDNTYLVFSQHNVYEIRDLMFIGFFTPAELYNQIEVGETIRIKVCGKRTPELSAYKNIIEVQKTTKQ